MGIRIACGICCASLNQRSFERDQKSNKQNTTTPSHSARHQFRTQQKKILISSNMNFEFGRSNAVVEMPIESEKKKQQEKNKTRNDCDSEIFSHSKWKWQQARQ